ncbi:hypothetical protein HU200_025946 [Digitaria exilis]|uniref:WRKY domain-containing protein n=1 Tax=Digitaria exilis TaxID=1010633 RepID=A0A835BYX0_9POAL|nr:hypothetical protein HU200_025946 [Digitaria exilis]
MALDREPMNLLSKKLTVGCYLNAHLQTLLGRPLDSRSQEEAMAVSQEVSRVFTEAMSVLKHANSCRVGAASMAPEIVSGNTIALITPTKEKRVRYYFKCNRHRRCEAKKKVQQQDISQDLLPPMFEVTYVNEHTCHVLRASDDDAASRLASSSPGTASRRRHAALAAGEVIMNTAASRRGDDGGGVHIVVGGAEEDEAIVSCLATVISGGPVTPPPPPPSWWSPAAAGASAGDPAAFVAPPLQTPASVDGGVAEDDDGATTMMMVDDDDTSFSWWDHSSFCPVEEVAGGGHHQIQLAMTNRHSDVHMGVARFADTVSPRVQACGAWRRA